MESQNEIKGTRRSRTWILGGMVVILLGILVALQAFGVGSMVPPDNASDTLLLYALSSLNFVAFILFTFIFIRSLLKLRRERKQRQLGSKLKTRLVVHFIAISLLPIAAMAVFSYLFVNRSIEKWFYKLPDDTLKEVSKVQDEAINNENRTLKDESALLSVFFEDAELKVDDAMLSNLVQRSGLSAIEVASNGRVLARGISNAGTDDSDELENTLDLALHTNGSGSGLQDGRDYDAVVTPLSNGNLLIIVSSRRSATNLNSVIAGYREQYQKLVNRQRRVRLLGLSTLGLLTLLLVFAATWVAIHLSRGIAVPIMALAEASNEIARGNLSHRVTTVAEDELALLADSFNKMTAELDENRKRIDAGSAELREKNLALEERRNYIETVLESLTTGVISLDANDRVTTLNSAAAAMLRVDPGRPQFPLLSEITSSENGSVLQRLLSRARRTGRASEQFELIRDAAPDSEPLPVALTATALKGPTTNESGVVLLIEDMTELLAAQRAAAWSEVARRLAHEIKNPLTPIQLSAERIARNFYRQDGSKEVLTDASHEKERARVSKIIDECTSTITREVEGLKAMVDEFSRFARLPHARPEPADLNEVVRQAVSLYEDRLEGVRLDVRLGRGLPMVLLDAEQMKRVLVNLIDNSLEAIEDSDHAKRVTIATGRDPARGLVLAEVTDTGHGIERTDFPKLFQPYFTTRGRGTGLGLAIVQRIVADHGGRIRAESNRPTGAKFTIELPESGIAEQATA